MTRLFHFPDAEREDEARAFADDEPRLRHFCTGPECGACDDIAWAACECDGTADECEQCR